MRSGRGSPIGRVRAIGKSAGGTASPSPARTTSWRRSRAPRPGMASGVPYRPGPDRRAHFDVRSPARPGSKRRRPSSTDSGTVGSAFRPPSQTLRLAVVDGNEYARTLYRRRGLSGRRMNSVIFCPVGTSGADHGVAGEWRGEGGMADLERFVAAAPVYDRALGELRAGEKRSHWMGFVYPRIAGLGLSPISQRYAIATPPRRAPTWSTPCSVRASWNAQARWPTERAQSAADLRRSRRVQAAVVHDAVRPRLTDDPTSRGCSTSKRRRDLDSATLARLH